MKKAIRDFIILYWHFFLFLIFFIGIFYKIFLFGLLPFPGDLLVSWFSPYKSGGWEGYSQWITHKEFIAADVVRQIYPWRLLAIELLKDGQFPLWNPYAFSGTPLLANIQSAVFYPANIIFFFFTPITAWVMYLLLQPILAFIGMYFFIRSLMLSKYAAVFTGIAFACIGYLLVWFELGIVGHSAVWLPFILWGITKCYEKKQYGFLLVSNFGIACSLLAGHMQTTAYVLIVVFCYYCFIFFNLKNVYRFIQNSWFLFLGVGISAVQLIPSFELLQHSARNAETSLNIFHQFQLPFIQIITLLAPDFFGNPATGNFWGRDYGEFIIYIGIIALVFAIIGLTQIKNTIVRFFSILGFISLLFALPTYFSEILTILQIPILGTSNPARAIFIFQFSLVVLAGFGIDALFIKKIRPYKVLFFIGLFYIVLWLGVIVGKNIFPQMEVSLSIAQRNLILPTFLFLATSLLCVAVYKNIIIQPILLLFIVVFMTYEYQYFFYKYSPFSPASYVFPLHSLVNYLQKETPPYRVFGYDTARFDTNITTYWQVLSPEGYDPLYIRRYGELIHAIDKGKLTQSIPRSDAVFPNSLPSDDSYSKQMIMNILSVVYVVDKDDSPKQIPGAQVWRFPQERYDFIVQLGKWRVYKNKQVLPRAGIFYNAEVISEDSAIIEKLFDKSFPYTKTLILEEKPFGIQFTNNLPTTATILSYKPNEIVMNAKTDKTGMLFLADNYYPGWKAYVDNKETKIYRANYTFRAIVIPEGTHTIRFTYNPASFLFGAAVTIICLLLFIGLYLQVILQSLRNKILFVRGKIKNK